MQLTKLIERTKNYIDFENMIIEEIKKWRAKDIPLPNYKKRSLWSERVDVVLLWGEAGSGKTEYLKIITERLSEEILWATNISDIKSREIYILDATNEIFGYDESKLKEIVKQTGAFVISSSWYQTRIFKQFEIKPSEETLLGTKWDEIRKIFKEYDFSIREKTLMSQIDNFSKIMRHEKHSLLWKAFEGLFETKNQKETYKSLAYLDPIVVSHCDDQSSFDYMIKKHIIQWNDENKCFLFSHPVISAHLFFRQKSQKVKSLSFTETEITKIKKAPSALIWWHKQLEKNDELLIDFFVKNKIKINVRDFFNLSINEKWIDDVSFKELNFNDISALSGKKYFQRIYLEYVNENIDASKELAANDLNKNDIDYFTYSIISPIRGDDRFPRIMNSMKKTLFWDHIIFDNSSSRKRMLNFILICYIKFYFDQNLSPLTISELKSDIFCGHDSECQFELFEFVDKCWNLVNHEKMEMLDHYINNGIGRNYILDGSSIYSEYDDRFNTGRNADGEIFEIGHKAVNLFMYEKFEEPYNKIESTDFINAQIIDVMGIHKKIDSDISDPFLKFMILLFEKNVYYYKNLPILNEFFDPNLELPSQEAVKLLLEKKYNEFVDYFKSFIKRNRNTCYVRLYGDPIIVKNSTFFVWIYPIKKKDLFDPTLKHGDLISHDHNLYSSNKICFNSGAFCEVKAIENNQLDDFEIGFKLDDIDNDFKSMDGIIKMNIYDENHELLKYNDPASSTISNQSDSDNFYETYKDDLLPYIRNTLKLNNE